MTIQSFAWAYEQDIPCTKSWRVLLALANRADHLTGKVDFDVAEISTESKVKPHSIPRYLGALKRNEYLAEEKINQGGGGKCYWLLFSRETTAPWSWDAEGVDAAEKDVRAEFESVTRAPRKFSREKQQEERKIAATPTERDEQSAIIEGTDAYHAWVNYYRNVLHKIPPFVMWVTTKTGKQARGFYERTLFPPRQERIDDLEGAA